jgi:hypothetical protein
MRAGNSPTDALRLALAKVRSLSADEIIARHDSVLELFPKDLYPREAGQVLAQKAWVCRRAGRSDEAREYANQSVQVLQRLGLFVEADRALRLSGTDKDTVDVQREGIFNHSVFWAPFHLVGRVK